MRNAIVRVWADIVSPGKCRWCRKPIVWRTLFDTRGSVPFDATGVSYGVEKDDRGRKVERLCWNDRHDCAERPKHLKKSSATESWKPLPAPRGWR